MTDKIKLNQKNFNSYLSKKFKKDQKILISLSCGLDSTVLFNLISKSNFFVKKNIFYIFFDHQKRKEGKFEIKEFIHRYKMPKTQIFIKTINSKYVNKSFQNISRVSRHDFIKKISNKKKIKNIFLGHHLNDIYETFFLREIQQSNILGLSSVFSSLINDLNFHRPLVDFKKEQIKYFAIKNKLFWCEDRTNMELNYTRNKIRHFLDNKNNLNKLVQKRNKYLSLKNINSIKDKYFLKVSDKGYKINYNDFNKLSNSLKFHVINSFYNDFFKNLPSKHIRQSNSVNLINLLKNPDNLVKDRSIFGGKITNYGDNVILDLN